MNTIIYHLLVSISLAALVFGLFGCGRSAEDKAQEADQQSIQASILFNQQSYVKAGSAVNQAILLNSELKRDSALGENYLLQALCQRKIGQYDSAISSFRVSLEFFHLFGDQRLERRGRIALAELFYDLGQYKDALSLASDAAGESKVFSDPSNALPALMLVAKANHRLRRFDREVTVIEELSRIDSQYESSVTRGELFRMRVTAYQEANDPDGVRNAFNQWRTYTTRSSDSLGLAKAYAAWGRYQETLHHPDSALKAFSQALGMLSGKASRVLQAELLSKLGNLSYRAQRYENTRFYYTDAERLAKQEDNIPQELLLKLLLIACDWKAAGDHGPATTLSELVHRSEEAAASCHQAGFRIGQAAALFLKGKLQEQRNDSTTDITYNTIIDLYEENPLANTFDDEMYELIDVMMDGEQSDWYAPLIQHYCSQADGKKAFALLERTNLYDLRNFFLRTTFVTGNADLDQSVIALESKRNVLKLLEQDILEELASGRRRNIERLELLKKLYPVNKDQAREAPAPLQENNIHWLVSPTLFSLKIIQDTLPPNTALVEFAPLSDALYILVVLKDTVYVRKVAVTSQHLLSLVNEYNRLIGDPRLNYNAPMFDETAAIGRVRELSLVLGSMLIEPMMPFMNNMSKVYVVPPKEFGWLPFHTLRSAGAGSAVFISKVNVSYVPSSAALLFSSKSEQFVRDIVGFGHPGKTNWDVEYELKDIRAFYDKAKMFFDTAATLRHLAQVPYDVLAVAAEFRLQTNVPDNSVLLLSDGITPFGLSEEPLGKMFSIPVPQTLLISNISPAEGGLARYAAMAFLAQGCRTVVATMWQGDRKAKKYFGEVFCTNLMGGFPASTAYHNAMVAMTKSEEFSRLHRWGLYFQFGR